MMSVNADILVVCRTDEPEFVEWGYGGMGSVKNTGQSSVWSRVQAGDAAAGLARQNNDEDDGSGMAWIKRRKEQREREARERAEREKEEAEAKVKEGAEVEGEGAAETKSSEGEKAGEEAAETPTEEQKESEPAQEAEQQVEQVTSVPTSAQLTEPSTPTPAHAFESKATQLAHITTAVTIPARSPHHRHHHSLSHSNSIHGHHTHSINGAEGRGSGDTARPHVTTPRIADFIVEEQRTPVLASARAQSESETDGDEQESLSSAMSTTSDDAEDGSGEDSPKDVEGGFGQEEEEEEEEEDEQVVSSLSGSCTLNVKGTDRAFPSRVMQERSRRTALGAGVEKIARHHKEEQGASAAETSSS